MKVWLKGFNFTFKCPAVINVWNRLWVYLTFCDVRNSIRSPFHPLRSVWHFYFFPSHIVESHHAFLTHVNYNSHLSLKLQSIFLYFSQHASLVLSLFNFIYVSGFNFRWVLNLSSFVSEKSPLLDIYLFSLLLMWMKTIFLWVMGYIKTPLSSHSFSYWA